MSRKKTGLKRVHLEEFKEPSTFRRVEVIVFRGWSDDSAFQLGFLPYGEFLYEFFEEPDVTFSNIPIKEIYYEPYRTVIRLRRPVDIIVYSSPPDKLYVEGTERALLDWSDWYRMSSLAKNNFVDVPMKKGVYQIRCVSSSGEPMKIPRVAGVDEYGILYIGAAWKRTLRNRIKTFWDVVSEGKDRPHSGAKTYVRYRFNRLFPSGMLEVRWAIVDNSRELEGLLLEEYLEKYLDTPPLNRVRGRRRFD